MREAQDTRGHVTLVKPVLDAQEAVAVVGDGDVVLVGGWGGAGVPSELLLALARNGAAGLSLVTNNCGMGHDGDVGVLFAAGKIARVVTSFPTHPDAVAFREQLELGVLDVELVPQGTLVERLRSGGAGIGGFYTPTAAGTTLAAEKEERVLGGRPHVLEIALRGDVALVHASHADVYGNLRYQFAAGGFNATMATAADTVVAEVDELLDEPLPPDEIDTPGIFVDVLSMTGGQR